MTPLPYRLLASAQALRGLASRSSMPAAPGLRIARELEEAAGALEVQQNGTAGVATDGGTYADR